MEFQATRENQKAPPVYNPTNDDPYEQVPVYNNPSPPIETGIRWNVYLNDQEYRSLSELQRDAVQVFSELTNVRHNDYTLEVQDFMLSGNLIGVSPEEERHASGIFISMLTVLGNKDPMPQLQQNNELTSTTIRQRILIELQSIQNVAVGKLWRRGHRLAERAFINMAYNIGIRAGFNDLLNTEEAIRAESEPNAFVP